jgi:hypothetical protein
MSLISKKARMMKGNSYAMAIIVTSNYQNVNETRPYKIVCGPIYTGVIILLLFALFASDSY